MKLFYFSYKQAKHHYSLLRAYAVICGWFNITVNRDLLHANNLGKLASVCLQQFSSIFESTVVPTKSENGVILCLQLLSKTLHCTLPLEPQELDGDFFILVHPLRCKGKGGYSAAAQIVSW